MHIYGFELLALFNVGVEDEVICEDEATNFAFEARSRSHVSCG